MGLTTAPLVTLCKTSYYVNWPMLSPKLLLKARRVKTFYRALKALPEKQILKRYGPKITKRLAKKSGKQVAKKNPVGAVAFFIGGVIMRLAEGESLGESIAKEGVEAVPGVGDAAAVANLIHDIMKEESEAEGAKEHDRIVRIIHGKRELPKAYQHIQKGQNTFIRPFLPKGTKYTRDNYLAVSQAYYNSLMNTEIMKQYPGGYGSVIGASDEITSQILSTINIKEYDAAKNVYSTIVSNYPEIRHQPAHTQNISGSVQTFNKNCMTGNAIWQQTRCSTGSYYFTMPILQEVLAEMWTQDVYNKYNVSRENLTNTVKTYRSEIPRIIPVK